MLGCSGVYYARLAPIAIATKKSAAKSTSVVNRIQWMNVIDVIGAITDRYSVAEATRLVVKRLASDLLSVLLNIVAKHEHKFLGRTL